MSRALRWSPARFRGPCSSATTPAAASTPACRIPPPRRLRYSRARVDLPPDPPTSSRPARQGPSTGKHHRIHPARRSPALGFPGFRRVEYAGAIHMHRQPAIVRPIADFTDSANGYTVPPAMLLGFSISIRAVRARCESQGRTPARLLPAEDAVGVDGSGARGSPKTTTVMASS